MKIREPWTKTFSYIKQRCGYHGSKYYKRDIKCLISIDELQYLWERDNADKMKMASIDRIDNDGDYRLDNCRYIEQSENARLGNIGKKLTKKALRACIKNIEYVNKNKLHYKRSISNYLNNKKVKDFKSIVEAAIHYGINSPTIHGCLTGKNKTCFGFEWRYNSEK